MSADAPRRPARRAAVWLGVVVLTCLVVPACWTVGSRQYNLWTGEAELNAVLAELDASDPGWRLEELLAAREARFPPHNRNPMELMHEVGRPKAFVAWRATGVDWRPTAPNRRPPEVYAADLARLRAECRPATDRLQHLKDMPPGGYSLIVPPGVISMDLDRTREVLITAALLETDAVAAALAGDPDRAVSSCHACLAAGRGIGDEPTAASFLMRSAIGYQAARAAERVLGLCEPQAGLAELQTALLAEADAPTLADGLRGERAMMDRATADIIRGVPGASSGPSPLTQPRQAFRDWRARASQPADRAEMLRLLTAFLAAARRPSHERLAALAAVPDPPEPEGSGRYPFAHSVRGFTEAGFRADLRTATALRSAAAGIACERYRQRTGRWPNTWADVSDILPVIPLDPHTGQPLPLVRRADGLTVGPDPGIRLYDLPHRAAPPEDRP